MIRWAPLFTTSLLIARSAFAGLVAAGQVHTCAWDGRDATPAVCWGYNGHQELEAPVLRNAVALGAGAWHNCALHESTIGKAVVDCWGDSSFRQGSPPAFSGKPILLSVGRWHNCALVEAGGHDSAVQCWGKNDFGQSDTRGRGLRSPSGVFAGSDYTCVQHDGGKIKCWGTIQKEYAVGEFSDVTSGQHLACSPVGGNGVACWSNHPEIPSLRRVSRELSCHLGAAGIACKHRSGEDDWVPPGLLRPRDLALGDWHLCALHDGGLRCWGKDNSEGQQNVPDEKLRFGPLLRSVADAPLFLRTLADFVYSFDAEFLETVWGLADGQEESRQLFLLNALRPFFVESGYHQTRDTYLLAAVREIDRWTAPSPSTGGARVLSSLGAGWPARKFAMQILAASLRSSRALVDLAQRQKIETSIARLGTGVAGGPGLSAADFTVLEGVQRELALNTYLSARVLMNQILMTYLKGDGP